MKIRELEFRQRKAKLCGIEGDQYFESIDFTNAHTNDFFVYVMDRVVSSGSNALDIGANIGVTTLLLSMVIENGAIYSFEPSPKAYPSLLETIRVNGIRNAHPNRLALADRRGKANFFDNPVSATASHLSEGALHSGGTTTVDMMTLDDFVSQGRLPRIDFIKIDVEGFEIEVLDGAKGTLLRDRPGVFIEFNSFTLIAYGNKNPRSVLERLLSDFPYVYCFLGGQHQQISGPEALHNFLHDNLVRHGCVDDLFCSFQPL